MSKCFFQIKVDIVWIFKNSSSKLLSGRGPAYIGTMGKTTILYVQIHVLHSNGSYENDGPKLVSYFVFWCFCIFVPWQVNFSSMEVQCQKCRLLKKGKIDAPSHLIKLCIIGFLSVKTQQTILYYLWYKIESKM